MPKLRLTLMNGETIEIDQETQIDAVIYTRENEYNMSPGGKKSEHFETVSFQNVMDFEPLEKNNSWLPIIIKILHQHDYFVIHQYPNVIYASASIFKIEETK
jgi:hypothetical protein